MKVATSSEFDQATITSKPQSVPNAPPMSAQLSGPLSQSVLSWKQANEGDPPTTIGYLLAGADFSRRRSVLRKVSSMN